MTSFHVKFNLSNGPLSKGFDDLVKLSGASRFDMKSNGQTLFVTCEGGTNAAFLEHGFENWGGPVSLRYDYFAAKKAGATDHPQHCIEQMGLIVNPESYTANQGEGTATVEVIGDLPVLPDYITVLSF